VIENWAGKENHTRTHLVCAELMTILFISMNHGDQRHEKDAPEGGLHGLHTHAACGQRAPKRVHTRGNDVAPNLFFDGLVELARACQAHATKVLCSALDSAWQCAEPQSMRVGIGHADRLSVLVLTPPLGSRVWGATRREGCHTQTRLWGAHNACESAVSGVPISPDVERASGIFEYGHHLLS
jgi:hypothetical protein